MSQSRRRVQFSTSWSERLSRLRLDRSSFVIGFCLLGLAGGVRVLQGDAKATSGPSRGPAMRQFDLKVQGEFTGLSPAQLQETEVTLYFPQLPYKVTRDWDELEHPRPEAFVMPVQLRAAASASLCYLRLQVRDQTLQAGKIQVEAGKPAASFPAFQVKL
ncbi:MAG: hypothetical protein KF760_18215 [Candidatus Eremiobacteraeota bacterium]|nr:hypothetical protein [Candidatus Eremiobacteraeota bacterium]MCW5866731.1 hypothetical protein [Candidatus Eremiobacteraeota bacterium]